MHIEPLFLLRLARSIFLKRGPVYVHYGITHRCNLACRMCHVRGDDCLGQELSSGQIGELFSALHRLGAVYVSIGGGEPFLRADLSSVVQRLVKIGLRVRVLTNGLSADEQSLRRLVAAGLREVSVSLGSMDPDRQAYLCAQEGVWEKIVHSMDLFSRIVPEKGRLLLINTVVSPLNVKELPDLSRFAQKKGYYISFVPVEAFGDDEFTFSQAQHPWIDESYDYLIREKRKRRNHIFNSSVFLEKSRCYLKSQACSWRCDAGRLYLSVNPTGELSICHRFRGMRFSERSLPDILRSNAFVLERERLISECPGCMRPCWAEISLASGNARCLSELLRLHP